MAKEDASTGAPEENKPKKTPNEKNSTKSEAPASNPASLTAGHVILVVGVSFLCYYNALGGDFVLDDDGCITTNTDVTDHDKPLESMLYNDYWGQSVLNRGSHKSYRPLTILTFRIDHASWGLNPFGYHLTNVILHALVSVVFMYFCRHMCFCHTHNATPSIIAALLFATHPIHCEAVTGVAGRADVLSGLFFLLSCLSYTWVPAPFNGSFNMLPSFLCIFLLGASMLSKEQGITAAAIWLVYDACVSYRFLMKDGPSLPQLPTIVMTMGPRAVFILFAVLQLLGIRFALLGDAMPDFFQVDNPAGAVENLTTRALTQHYLASRHLWLLLWPAQLCCDWASGSIPLVTEVTDERMVLTFVLYTCLLMLAGIAFFPSSSSTDSVRLPLVMGLALIVLPFIPASSMFFRVGFVLADRVLYMPSFGWCILLAHAVQVLAGDHVAAPRDEAAAAKKNDDKSKDKAPKTTPRSLKWHVAYAAALAIIGAYGIRTVARNNEWQTSTSLYESGRAVNPSNHKFWLFLAQEKAAAASKPGLDASLKKSLLTEAADSYAMAVKLDTPAPDGIGYNSFQASSRRSFGNVLQGLGRSEEATAQLMLADGLLQGHPASAHALGQLAFQQGKYEEAVTHYLKAMDLYKKLGVQPGGGGDDYWKTVHKRHPTFMDTPNGIGNCKMALGDFGGAETYYKLAMEAHLHEPVSSINYVTSLQAQSRFDEAHEFINPYLADIMQSMDQPATVTKGWSKGDKASAYAKVGVMHIQTGNMKDANIALKASTKFNPKNAEATIFLAVSYAELGQKETAVELANKALELDPTNAQVVGNHEILTRGP
jgi:tetratricopeptide (TPR) repeat protein